MTFLDTEKAFDPVRQVSETERKRNRLSKKLFAEALVAEVKVRASISIVWDFCHVNLLAPRAKASFAAVGQGGSTTVQFTKHETL